jgi:hypothetical protein
VCAQQSREDDAPKEFAGAAAFGRAVCTPAVTAFPFQSVGSAERVQWLRIPRRSAPTSQFTAQMNHVIRVLGSGHSLVISTVPCVFDLLVLALSGGPLVDQELPVPYLAVCLNPCQGD